MKLILRPAKPPMSFAMRKVAPSALPIVPYAEAGPLAGQVLPMRISVSVTPVVSAARRIAGAAGTKATAAAAVSKERLCNMDFPSQSFAVLFRTSGKLTTDRNADKTKNAAAGQLGRRRRNDSG